MQQDALWLVATHLYELLDPRGQAVVCNREVPGWNLEAN